MPTIPTSAVPTVAPGNLFTTLTTNDNLTVRWLTATDPCYYAVLNRPITDLLLRELILAKSIDQLNLSVGHQSLFPFVVQAKILYGTVEVDIPAGWIWDLHLSAPTKWENFRLAKIKRISGNNGTSYTGALRLIFTANEEGSTTETAIFYADYDIDSVLTYQRMRLQVVDNTEEVNTISSGERETVSGFITFRTLDATELLVQAFYNALDPPVAQTDSDSDGYFDSPSVYEVVSTAAGTLASTSDFSFSSMNHGTGLLVDSTYNTIPALDSDVNTWITTFNYPFATSSSLISATSASIVIPSRIFEEFNITAPAGDEPTGDVTGEYYPVWITKIVLVDTDRLRFYFATHTTDDSNPSLDAIEFATLDLTKSMAAGRVVPIVPNDDLLGATGSDESLYHQHFGRGHVLLSSIWDGTDTTVDDFFDAFALLAGGEAEFTQSTTRLGTFAISRVPKFVPTRGQSQALAGSGSRRSTPIAPSSDNLYVTEQDYGLGSQVDLEAQSGVTSHVAIGRYGNAASLVHPMVYLCIDHSKIPTGSETGASTFYDDHILPRLTALFGHTPSFGDIWYDGTSWLIHNGDSWQTL